MNGPDSVTLPEIAEAKGVTERTVRRRAAKEGWKIITVNKNGAKKIAPASLPDDIRAAVAKRQLRNTRLGATGDERNVSILYKGIARPVPTAVGSPELTEQQNRIALAWADLLRLYMSEKKRARSQKESVVEAAKTFIEGYNTGLILPTIFAILGKVSWKTAEAKLKKFKAGYDYTVLAPRWGNRRGQRKVTGEEFNTALSFALHPNRLRMNQVIRMTRMALRKRQISSPSHEATIRRALEDWRDLHYDQWVFCREGEKALNDKCLPYIERDIGLLDVGEVLVADGHMLNFQCLNPYTGKPCRAALLMWYDWASCYPVGWEIMPTENVQAVAAGLRRAILTLGKMPTVAYLDNGKAFKAKVFTSKDVDFEDAGFYGMFARLGIETTFAWPYNAQSKTVERFFGTFNELERLMPTYTGASIQDKPAHMLRNEKLHKKMHEKKYGGWVPTVEEAGRIIAGWIEEYAQRPHRGLKGLCPGEVLEAGKGPGIDEGALRFLMMSMESKPVHRNGIHFLGRNYYDDALYGYKKRAMIRYDLEDLSKVYVYDRTGERCLCEACAIDPVHPMAKLTGQKEDLALVKRGIEHKRGLKKATEKIARAYVEDAPVLVPIPSLPSLHPGAARKDKIVSLPRAEAERIEAEAAKMTVLELKDKDPDPIYMTEPDRYEAYLERECRGDELSLDEMQFMRYFEKTSLYRQLKERFEFLQELWLSGEENPTEGSQG